MDKMHHLIYSGFLVLLLHLFLDVKLAGLFSLLMGTCKELIYDGLLGKGCMDFNDMTFNILGIILIGVFVYVVQRLCVNKKMGSPRKLKATH